MFSCAVCAKTNSLRAKRQISVVAATVNSSAMPAGEAAIRVPAIYRAMVSARVTGEVRPRRSAGSTPTREKAEIGGGIRGETDAGVADLPQRGLLTLPGNKPNHQQDEDNKHRADEQACCNQDPPPTALLSVAAATAAAARAASARTGETRGRTGGTVAAGRSKHR